MQSASTPLDGTRERPSFLDTTTASNPVGALIVRGWVAVSVAGLRRPTTGREGRARAGDGETVGSRVHDLFITFRPRDRSADCALAAAVAVLPGCRAAS